MHNIADLLEGLHDLASLCLAIPPLGISILMRERNPLQTLLCADALNKRACTRQGLLMLAIRVVSGDAVMNEAAIRRLTANQLMSTSHALSVAKLAQEAGSTFSLSITVAQDVTQDEPHDTRRSSANVARNASHERWNLLVGDTETALLREMLINGTVIHYQGESGAECKVRMVSSDGKVVFYAGERGEERRMRSEYPDGSVCHWEGERGAERQVRGEYCHGWIAHFEGERGAEVKVRAQTPDGGLIYFEGVRGGERVVRLETRLGWTIHYEGERSAERVVRMEGNKGIIIHFDGERGAEREVWVEGPDSSRLPMDAIAQFKQHLGENADGMR